MESGNYYSHEEREKCQCITFDESGQIMGSCETLFTTSRFTLAGIKKEFPFLFSIMSYLKGESGNGAPLFFPEVEFECNGYRSVCDFTFMKTEDAMGIKRFIWMIYDNSIHYRDLIKNGSSGKTPKVRLTI